MLFPALLGLVAILSSCSKLDNQVDALNDAAYLNDGSSSLSALTLPQSVSDNILSNYQSYEVTSVDATNENGSYTYNVALSRGADELNLTYSNSWNFQSSERGGGGKGKGKGGNLPDSLKHKHGFFPIDSLCQSAKDYVTTNYAGYTIRKAIKRDSAGIVTYIVVARLDSTTVVALKFDANCNFVSTIDLPIDGKGHGKGHKGGGKGTAVDLATIPTSVTDFLASNYTGFTISNAVYVEGKGTPRYIVKISDGTNTKVLVFDSNWAFVKEL